MSSQDLIPGKQEQPDPAFNEVQFALVIARMIETVQNSPEHMRQTVYDLARYKLKEQFTHTEANDIRRSQQALETAIRGVEEFSRQQFSIRAPSPVPQLGDGSTGTAAGDFPPPESSPRRSPGRAWIPIEIPLALQKPATRLGRSSRGPRHCWPSSLRSLRYFTARAIGSAGAEPAELQPADCGSGTGDRRHHANATSRKTKSAAAERLWRLRDQQ